MFSKIARLGFIEIAFCGAIGAGLFYFFQYQGNIEASIKKLDNKQVEQVKVEKTLKKKELELDGVYSFRKQVGLKEKAILYFLEFISNDITSIDLFTFLNEEAKSTGVNVEDKKDGELLELDGYQGLRMDIKVSGSFSQILLFLANLTGQKQIIVVDAINLNLKEVGVVVADIRLLSFKYKKPEPKKEKEQQQKKGKNKNV